MKTTRPELGIERLLIELERDLVNATDEDISAVASELGIKLGMKGSSALFGITHVVQLKNQYDNSTKQSSDTKNRGNTTGSRRRSKGDTSSST